MSSGNHSLVFPTSVDLTGLDRDLVTAENMVGDFADRAADRLSTIRSPSVRLGATSGGSGSGGGDAAASLAAATGPLIAAFSPIGPMLAASVAGAVGPITRTMSEVGRVISRQLADQGKFNRLNASITETRDRWKSRIGEMQGDFKRFVDGLNVKMARLPAGSVIPPEDLSTLNRMKAELARSKRAAEGHNREAAQSLGRGGLMQAPPSVFDRRQKPYDGGGHLGKVASVVLPKSVGGMKALGSATGAASTAAKGLGFALTGALGPIGLLFAAGTALHAFFKGGLKGASDLDETIARTNIVLGQSSPAVQKFADDMGTKFGFVKGVTLDTAASLSGLGRSLGQLKGEELGAFSMKFTKLSAELAAFSHVDMGDAADAIRIGLTGNQSDLLKQRGVIMDEDTTKAYAYAHGIAKVGTELNEQQKFAARTGQITRGLAKVEGYLESTSGSAANQTRLLWGTLENLGTSLGAIVLPAITEGIVLLNEFGAWATKSFGDSGAAVEAWKNTFLDATDWVVATVHNLPAAFEVARLKIVEVLLNIGEWIEVLGPNAAMVATYIGRNWFNIIRDSVMRSIALFRGFANNLTAVGTALGEWFADPTQGFKVNWTPLLDGFVATAEKFPDVIRPILSDMSKEIADASKPIGDEVLSRRAARALGKPAAKVLGNQEVDPEVAKSKKGPKEKTLGAALELGSKEAYSSVANAVSGRGDPKMDRVAKAGDETARNTRIIAEHLAGFHNPPKDRSVRQVKRVTL